MAQECKWFTECSGPPTEEQGMPFQLEEARDVRSWSSHVWPWEGAEHKIESVRVPDTKALPALLGLNHPPALSMRQKNKILP